MIKNSSEYLDVQDLVDFVLDYGRENLVPDEVYQAALRLQQYGLPKAQDAADVLRHEPQRLEEEDYA